MGDEIAEIINLSKSIEPLAPQGVLGFSADLENVWTGSAFCPGLDLRSVKHIYG